MKSETRLRLELILWPVLSLEAAGVSYLVWEVRSPERLTTSWVMGVAAIVIGVISLAFVIDTWLPQKP
jgi:hypothetical protein